MKSKRENVASVSKPGGKPASEGPRSRGAGGDRAGWSSGVVG